MHFYFILGSDARSAELYYHKACHVLFKRRYQNMIEGDKENITLKEFIALSRVQEYVEDSNTETRLVKDLEKKLSRKS